VIEPKPMLRGDWSAVVHGGVDPAELAREGMTADGLLDFSANLNPFGPSPAVAEAIRATRVDCYPDRQCRALQQRLAERLRVEVDEVMLGNGSVELIYLLAGAYVSVGERVLIVGPAFAEYERACRLHGGEVAVVSASPAVGFAPPLEEVAASLSREAAALGLHQHAQQPDRSSRPPRGVAAVGGRLSADAMGAGRGVPRLSRR
jgi:histidinol-phosphate/aromatic aminotransferase/cobyric acid decarboxylase-like protein